MHLKTTCIENFLSYKIVLQLEFFWTFDVNWSMRTFFFHVYEEMKNGYTIKVIQAKNVIKGVFIYMEYLYRKDKYKKVTQKTIKIIMCLRRFLCRNWFQFIKVKFAFHIIMYIITNSNNQGATKSSPCKQTFTCEINC